jgi:hypothetical protein
MTSTLVRGVVVLVVSLGIPIIGHAQEAGLAGDVTDSTNAVLPGVTIAAVHEASGNTFVAVSDQNGGYRLALRTGVYRITAELAGFATLTRRLELGVGQQAVANLQLSPSSVQESVTVTGQAPLLDVTQSKVGGNIDTRQMQEIPVNGRNAVPSATLPTGGLAAPLRYRRWESVERSTLGVAHPDPRLQCGQ